MKRIVHAHLIILLLIGIGCSSPQKLIQQGQNNKATHILVRKLKQNPGNQSLYPLLSEAYSTASKRNLDTILSLKKTGQPDIWYDVYKEYMTLNNRQKQVASLPEEVLRGAHIKMRDYEADIADAKTKAAAYFYAHAKKLLDDGSKIEARQAYNELIKIAQMYQDYKDVDALLRKALVMGTDYILYEIENNSTSLLPSGFVFTLQEISLTDLDERFLNFNTIPVQGRDYDFVIKLVLNSVQVTPDKIGKERFTEKKKVRVGWIEKKDSTGKVIKIPDYQIVTCDITKVHQYKAARITGNLDFIDNHNGNLLLTTPVSAETLFNHYSAYAKGDERACDPGTLALINTSKVPYPSDTDLVIDAAGKLNATIRQTIWVDESYLK